MTRHLSELEFVVIKFALECEGNLQSVQLPSEAQHVVEEYDGFVRFGEALNGSRKVGSAAVITDSDHVVIDVYCDDNSRVYSIDYVSMYGNDPPKFPQSVDELSCDVSYFKEEGPSTTS